MHVVANWIYDLIFGLILFPLPNQNKTCVHFGGTNIILVLKHTALETYKKAMGQQEVQKLSLDHCFASWG